MLADVPDKDLEEMIASAVSDRTDEMRKNFSTDLLGDVDKFYVNAENESVTWAYFNPDSSAGRSCPQRTAKSCVSIRRSAPNRSQ